MVITLTVTELAALKRLLGQGAHWELTGLKARLK